DVSFAGVRSGKTSKGHRFLTSGDVNIASADAYVDTMRKAHVLVNRDERAKTMMDRIAAAAKDAGGVHDPEPSLVAEKASLFEDDKKAKIEDRVEKLGGIVFHNRLGTVREKVARMEKLATKIAAAIGLDAKKQELVARAAHICKFDLVSLMVGEFPELQGEMG